MAPLERGPENEGEHGMPVMDCPTCDGTGYTDDAAGEAILCPLCDGAGILVTDEGDADTEDSAVVS